MSKKSKRLLFIFCLIATGLLVLDRLGLASPIHGTLSIFTNPIGRVITEVRLTILDMPFVSNRRLLDLEKQVAELNTVSAQNEILRHENETLRQQIEGKTLAGRKLLIAHVAGGDRNIVIDRGDRDGVKAGMTVAVGNFLVGKVISVSGNNARVVLPTDPQNRIPAWTAKLTRGIIQGSFGQRLSFKQVLQGEDLAVGDTVLTTGEDGYQQNLAIGKVIAVTGEAREVYKQAEVEPVIDFLRLRTVFVIVE